jgi:hypothetical protein
MLSDIQANSCKPVFFKRKKQKKTPEKKQKKQKNALYRISLDGAS